MDAMTIFFRRGRSSVEIETDGAERKTSASDMAKVIDNMSAEDRAMMVRWCHAVIECAEGRCKTLAEW